MEFHPPRFATVGGRRLAYVPLANDLRLAERIPGAQLKVYEDTGHIPEVERAEEFNADLLAFLAA
jgi:pimeloyl-ACP methyl ester carboxylesterase